MIGKTNINTDGVVEESTYQVEVEVLVEMQVQVQVSIRCVCRCGRRIYAGFKISKIGGK